AGDAGARERARRLEELKLRLQSRVGDTIHRYRAQWDSERAEVGGLDEFARTVEENLRADILAEYGHLRGGAPATWQQEERAALESFVRFQTRQFTGRARVLSRLMELALDGDRRAVCLHGEPGAGKSAVMAELCLLLTGQVAEEDPLFQQLGSLARQAAQMTRAQAGSERRPAMLVLAHSAGVTQRSRSADRLLRRWIGELAEFLGVEDPVARWEAEERQRARQRQEGGVKGLLRRLFSGEEAAGGPSADEVMETFSSLLVGAAARARVVILLDALNELDPTADTFLARLAAMAAASENVRVIASAVPGRQTQIFANAGGALEQLEPLSRDEAGAMIRAVCQRYHRARGLTERIVSAILGHTRPDGRPSWENPLWLELAVEAINNLDREDYRRLETDPRYTALDDYMQRIEQLLVDTAQAVPGDVAGAYDWMLERAEDVVGRHDVARAIACLLALSRSGWREEDLAELVPQLVGLAEEQWDPISFTLWRRALLDHVVQSGAQGQWYFHHAQLREAAMRRYLGFRPAGEPLAEDVYLAALGWGEMDVGSLRQVHRIAAHHLLRLPESDPMRSEIMFHLMGADDA
ncbi:MAG: AAA family ATPase, partial [Armatimonadetes bacterium]|nr:AAA family ATPase [Armatimonadota bacterium]